MKQVAYEYQNLSIPGGGFVTGFLYHPMDGTLYCRTDIGGCYRYIRDAKNGEMTACNSVTAGELRYIRDNWSRFDGFVKFYKDGLEVLPPWMK